MKPHMTNTDNPIDFPKENEPVAWEGAEEWERLAWELCADEHGEESCTDLIWTTDVIPEPWGDRWQTYEDEAKRMIAMVRKCTHPVKEHFEDEPQAEELHEILQSNAELTDEKIYEIWFRFGCGMPWTANTKTFARALIREAQSTCNGFCGEYECKETLSGCKRKAQER